MHIGIIGCGQLARLMALAAKKMGVKVSFVALNNESISCVEELGPIVYWQENLGAHALVQALGFPDVVTVEREDINGHLLFELSMEVKVYPRPEVVTNCQNRLKEKMALKKLNISSTPWVSATSVESVKKAVETIKYPLVIKSLEQGYDGKNQWHIDNQNKLDLLLKNTSSINWIIEPKINFIKEVSLIGVRSEVGEIKFYPLTENYHEKGILRTSVAPDISIDKVISDEIKSDLELLLNSWQYIGVIAMELFILPNGFMVNELAPRVHNSGHWTDYENITSQFENHIRAILGLPLGSTKLEGFAGMVNILGSKNNLSTDQKIEGKLHLYNKSFKINRKLGHVNLSDFNRNELINKISKTNKAIYHV